jgi:hypothetical protein
MSLAEATARYQQYVAWTQRNPGCYLTVRGLPCSSCDRRRLRGEGLALALERAVAQEIAGRGSLEAAA